MDLVVVIIAMLVGLAAAVPAQLIANFFNLRGRAENYTVAGAFAAGMLISAPFIGNMGGV